MPAPFLSAVIITKNEENHISTCINSLKNVVDEIIVVDSFSTDKTVAMAESLGAKVVQRQWEGYSVTKNFANEIASGAYILSIDADEALTDGLQQSVLAVKNHPEADAYDVNRLTNYCGKWIKHCGWYPEYKTRLFKKGIAEWQGEIHEELVFKSKVNPKKLKGDLLHYSYPTIESHLRKVYPYAYLAAKKDIRKGKKYNLLFHGILKPLFMFFKKYFIQLGILYGKQGLAIAVISSFERHLRYLNYWELTKNKTVHGKSSGFTS